MMKDDPAAAAVALVTGAIKKSFAALRVAFPCEVLSFNQNTGMAVVQPLLQLTDFPPAPIQNVPALGQKFRTTTGEELVLYPSLKKGDRVYVVCADRHVRTAQTGKIAKPDSNRIHSQNDAVIVGVYM